MSSIVELVAAESQRQSEELSLIASENYMSKNVLDILGSPLANKYAEGYPGKRYYAGNRIIDAVEQEAIQAAKELFQTDYHVNVQPYSGSPANLAAYSALLKPGDTILALDLAHGGHLTHGHKVSLTGQVYRFVHYGVSQETELIDYEEVRQLAIEHRPRLIIAGATAYPALLDFVRFARIAKEVNAFLMVDMAHIAGLIAGGVHPSPFGVADIITTSTHKTLRGPRGGMIFCRPEFAPLIDKAVFPGLQGGPHMHTIGALAVALQEAKQPSFHQYARQVVSNAKQLAFGLHRHGFRLVADGTDNHLFLLDLTSTRKLGAEAQAILESIGIICNKNMIPFDTQKPTNPSGLRFGTAAVTSRGMKEKEMEQLADIIAAALQSPVERPDLAEEVKSLAKKFRIPTHY
ncbi:MAG: serine hydroxymethyltransferase [Patescibacteria group bacterium]|nr:serine hydroxymethyltransferase [Patescibacteria group bacterium]